MRPRVAGGASRSSGPPLKRVRETDGPLPHNPTPPSDTLRPSGGFGTAPTPPQPNPLLAPSVGAPGRRELEGPLNPLLR